MKVRNRKVRLTPQQRKKYKTLAEKIDREEKAQIIEQAREMFARQELLLHAMGRLKAQRQRQGLSLGDVSRITGISKPSLSLLEAGKANPTLDTLVRYAQALRVKLKLDIAA